ncbi:pantetheine-phosphate adenylyltransferase family protein [Aspergillus terreus]|uniref:Pantetheine-phosphate adenylyltransferase family protein n=1 Tax=Aspergillus terreus TaxID=33178 RepID=A0A5M3Z4Z3_ASPTE|nr:hypothetical protein ATETN484_0007041600 [Aspergillus terreus]GFF16221.1 pantetheine-phosphate adenylyltransferase family protein [Aspergillus terreus]
MPPSPDRMAQTSALLLLPPPPSASFPQFKEAYEPILSEVYSKLAQSLDGLNQSAILDIALSLPGLLSPECQPRARMYGSLRRFLANIYRLIGIVSVERNIELGGPGGVDARVIFLDFDTVIHPTQATISVSQTGPILDLETLARSARLWDAVYYPDNAVGQTLATAFSRIYSQAKDPNAGAVEAISGVPNWTTAESLIVPGDAAKAVAHYSIAVGGTFDHFHIGHKQLLTATALALDPVQDSTSGRGGLLTIGVSGDELLVNKKYAEFLESWEERCASSASFLTAIMDFCPPASSAPRIEQISQPGPNGKYTLMEIRRGLTLKLVRISDPFGPTITDESISALVVSQETSSGGAAVNRERAKKGWKGLEVFEVDILHSGEVPSDDVESFASKISSTDLRRRRMELAQR